MYARAFGFVTVLSSAKRINDRRILEASIVAFEFARRCSICFNVAGKPHRLFQLDPPELKIGQHYGSDNSPH
jgi:hypothetical protein